MATYRCDDCGNTEGIVLETRRGALGGRRVIGGCCPCGSSAIVQTS